METPLQKDGHKAEKGATMDKWLYEEGNSSKQQSKQSKTKTPFFALSFATTKSPGIAFCSKQKATTTTKITWYCLYSIRTKANDLILWFNR